MLCLLVLGSIVEGYPVVEPSLNYSRRMTMSNSDTMHSLVGSGRERRSSSMSSNRSRTFGGHMKRSPVTPSILQPIYSPNIDGGKSEENLTMNDPTSG